LVTSPRFGELASEQTFAYIERLAQFAEQHDHTLLELAFGWLLAQEGVASVIAGAMTPEQAGENARAGQAWRLTPAVLRGFVWQLVSYPFVGTGGPSIWFLLELLVLFWFGRDVFWRLAAGASGG
jgi:hypothetical protein